MRRGQGATEYLVILGAVLLVALVIVSLLGWFPSLGGSTREQQSKSYWASASPFSLTTYFNSPTSITFSVSNRGSDRLNLTSINLSDPVGTASFEIYNISNTGGAGNGNPGGVSFNAGEEKIVYNYTGPLLINQCTGTTGAVFDYKTVTFTYSSGGVNNIKQTGARPLVWRCS